MAETLGLLEESRQLASELGYRVREEALGDLPGGACTVGGVPLILLNLEQSPAERLDRLVRALAADPRTFGQPMSRLLAARLRAAGAEGSRDPA